MPSKNCGPLVDEDISAFIALYSRLALPHGFENYLDATLPALERCLDACYDLASIIGAISDEDLQCICPPFIFEMFVAARFILGKPPLLLESNLADASPSKCSSLRDRNTGESRHSITRAQHLSKAMAFST